MWGCQQELAHPLRFSSQAIYVVLKPHMVVLLNQNILHGELLSPRPPHDGFRYFYSLFNGICPLLATKGEWRPSIITSPTSSEYGAIPRFIP